MLKQLANEKGAIFPVAVVILFITTAFVSYSVIAFESKIKIYNSLEFANVRATMNLLENISK